MRASVVDTIRFWILSNLSFSSRSLTEVVFEPSSEHAAIDEPRPIIMAPVSNNPSACLRSLVPAFDVVESYSNVNSSFELSCEVMSCLKASLDCKLRAIVDRPRSELLSRLCFELVKFLISDSYIRYLLFLLFLYE